MSPERRPARDFHTRFPAADLRFPADIHRIGIVPPILYRAAVNLQRLR